LGVLQLIDFLRKGSNFTSEGINVFLAGNIQSIQDLFDAWATTAVPSEVPAPAAVVLHESDPNPFNLSTTVRFDLSTAAHVRLVVYDVTGREVAVLVDEVRAAGGHALDWRPGSQVGSGVYLLRLEAGADVDLGRLVVLK